MKSGIRNLHNHSSIINEFKEMHKHADRHLNEIIFTKCNDKTCCKTFRSEMVRDHFNGKVKFPSPSISKNGHYNTFFQECINQQKRYGDVGQPTGVEKQLGVCDFCPSFAFKSKTEKEKHNSIFHRRQKLPARKPNVKVFKCLFEGCAETFQSQASLSRHQTAHKHRKRDQVRNQLQEKAKKRKGKQQKKQFTIADVLRRKPDSSAQPSSSVAQNESDDDQEASIDLTDVRSSRSEADNEVAVDDILQKNVKEIVEDAGIRSSIDESDVDTDDGEMEIVSSANTLTNDEVAIEVAVGEYIAAVYDKMPYIGKVVELDEDSVHVDFMEPYVKENSLSQNSNGPRELMMCG